MVFKTKKINKVIYTTIEMKIYKIKKILQFRMNNKPHFINSVIIQKLINKIRFKKIKIYKIYLKEIPKNKSANQSTIIKLPHQIF